MKVAGVERHELTIPSKWKKLFLADEMRILIKPEPGLLLLDAKAFASIREMLADPEFVEQYDILVVPKAF